VYLTGLYPSNFIVGQFHILPEPLLNAPDPILYLRVDINRCE
jgi:hypothetical protein